VSLTLGIIGFFTFGILLIGSVVGTALGFVALKRESSEPATYGGKGIAIAGLVLNIGALVMIFPLSIISAIAIPNLLASRRAANEASALRIIQVITTAEQTYQIQDAKGEYGELNELISDGLIDPSLATGERNGYRFTLVNNDSDFELSATPIAGAGRRSFLFISEDWELHVRVGGLPATADDPPLESYNDSQPSSRRAAYAPAN
jgi:competence protein ComGC